MSLRLEVVADGEAAARFVAERLAEAARAGGHVVLTGGETPRRAYEIAAELEPDWSRTEIWWGDKRCVPPDNPWSNYLLAKDALLDRLQIGPAAVHRILAAPVSAPAPISRWRQQGLRRRFCKGRLDLTHHVRNPVMFLQ